MGLDIVGIIAYDGPMSYFGGKGQDGVYQVIINQMPEHRVYIEPFLGGGSIMLRKKPAEKNIGLDLDRDAVEQFAIACRQKCREDLEVVSLDGIGFMAAGLFTPDTLIYCDPPYLHETRSCDRCRYNHELEKEDHIQLLGIILRLPCMVMISHYPNPLYDIELAGWRSIDYQAVKRSGQVVTERLYMNYPEPLILHDDKYLGVSSASRQDINRRIKRTVRRVMSWPTYERVKMLRELLEQIPEVEQACLGLELQQADLPLLQTPVYRTGSSA